MNDINEYLNERLFQMKRDALIDDAYQYEWRAGRRVGFVVGFLSGFLAAILVSVMVLHCSGCRSVSRTMRKGLKEELREEINPIVDERIETAKRELWYDMAWKGGGGSLIALLFTILGLRESQHRAIFKMTNGKNHGQNTHTQSQE